MASRNMDRAWKRIAFSLFSVILFIGMAASTLALESKKPAPPDPKAIAAVSTAATALMKEATAGLKDKTENLREKCDYFTEKPSPDITPEAILIGLEKSQSGDPRMDSYVKWQLLSGISGAFPEELAARATTAYRRAAEPSNHPGLEHAQLSKTLNRIGIMKKEKMGEINKGFGETVDKTAKDNLYILHYRKEFYSHLPVSGDSLMAGLEDIFSRAKHGVPAGDMWTAVSGSIQSWSLSAESRQRDSVLQAMNQLLTTARSERAKPYVRVEWIEDAKNMGLHWKDEMVVDEKKVQAMIDSVRDSARMLGDVGFKKK